MDPLLDDAVDFHTRLRRVLPLEEQKTKSILRIYRRLPHGFWGLGRWLPEARVAMDEACRWCAEMLNEV